MSWQSNPGTPGVRKIDRAEDAALPYDSPSAAFAQMTDAALMVAVRAGDAAAFSALYDRYADLVFSASLRILGDRQLAEDTTQDVFIRVWQRPELFVAARGRFPGWLMSITRNRSVDELRSRGRRLRREASAPADSDDDLTADLPTEARSDDPAWSAQLHDEQARVRAALREIPTEQRAALTMAYFQGLTQQEIAEALSEPLGTIKTRIRLGMQKLRRSLKDEV